MVQLVWRGYLNHTGYSNATQDYLLSLLSVTPELNIKFIPLNALIKNGISQKRQLIFEQLRNTPNITDQIHIYHSIPHLYRRHTGAKKHIGVCLFETMNPPKNWIQMMNEMDLVITASQFNQRIFSAHGATVPIVVIPHALNTELFHENVNPHGRYNRFTFLGIGIWKQRKNWEQLIKSFYNAFENKDNVCLLLKTDKPNEMEKSILHIKRNYEWRAKNTAPIYLEPKKIMEFEEIPNFMKRGDVYISTSLGEGFSITAQHALALNMPIIVPKYSGFLEFAKPEWTTYIEPCGYQTQPVMDGIPQFANCIWPTYKITEISYKMRKTWENFKQIQVTTKNGYDFVHKNHNYQTIGQRLKEALLA